MRQTDKSLPSEKFKQVVGGLGKPLGKNPAPRPDPISLRFRTGHPCAGPDRDILGWPRGAVHGRGATPLPAAEPPTATTMADTSLRLDPSQVEVARSVFGGRNVAAVGAAGCGKSTLLTLLVRAARLEWGDSSVVVLAWAGSAAQLVGGQTVSSLLRVSVGDVSKERILSHILTNPEARSAITAARLVVIDEAPTIPNRWFDRLEYVFRRTALPTLQCRPFGGRIVFGTCSLLFVASQRVVCAYVDTSGVLKVRDGGRGTIMED